MTDMKDLSHLSDSTAVGMADMQKLRDHRNIAINKVGVKDIRYPIVVLDKRKERQQTVARINMYVDLPHHFKGTHMSRFIEVLGTERAVIDRRVNAVLGIVGLRGRE